MDYSKLNEMLEDEYKDVVLYVDLYKNSENSIFRDIAREEMTHAKHVKNILADAGKLEDCKELRGKAEKALNEV